VLNSEITRQCFWSRHLRNAAALARIHVLKCLKSSSCQNVVGTGAGGDLTKQFDLIAEQSMVEYLRKFSAFTLVSEEAGIQRIGSKPVGYIIMDPIDGSTNLSHGISFACVAIAFATELLFSSIEVAVVLDLFSGGCYHATYGMGAFKDRQRIRPANFASDKPSLVGVDDSFPPTFIYNNLSKVNSSRIQYTRHFGANALELCYVADGSLDGFIDLRGVFRGTDLGAASLILKEAGATLVNPEGSAITGPCTNDARYAYIAARDPVLTKKLLAFIEKTKSS
jgi:myo-inositol-1(or 4)-monophosphatase